MKRTLIMMLVVTAASGALLADTYTLQNDGVTNPVTDGYVRMSNPTTAYYDNWIKATVISYDRRVSMLKFDLPSEVLSLTNSADVASATLKVTLDPGSFWQAGTVYLYQLGYGSDWDENVNYYYYDGTNNWAGVSAGSNPCRARITSTELSFEVTGSQFDPDVSYIEFDVTDIVRNWTVGGGSYGNYGFLFAPYDNDGTGGYPGYDGTNVSFYSSRYSSDYTLTPKLTIETVPEPMTVSLLVLGGTACLIRKKKSI